MSRLEKLLLVNYFAKISVARFNQHQMNMHCIGLGYDHKNKINPSSQFNYKKSRKCKELRRLLNEKSYKMKSILRINT